MLIVFVVDIVVVVVVVAAVVCFTSGQVMAPHLMNGLRKNRLLITLLIMGFGNVEGCLMSEDQPHN